MICNIALLCIISIFLIVICSIHLFCSFCMYFKEEFGNKHDMTPRDNIRDYIYVRLNWISTPIFVMIIHSTVICGLLIFIRLLIPSQSKNIPPYLNQIENELCDLYKRKINIFLVLWMFVDIISYLFFKFICRWFKHELISSIDLHVMLYFALMHNAQMI